MNEVKSESQGSHPQKTAAQKTLRYSVFVLAEKLFAIEVLAVTEVVPFPKLTEVPNVPENILGVFNSRGSIIPLLEINTVLGLDSIAPDSGEMILILERDKYKFGILVNRVMDIVNIEESEIQIPTREVSSNIAGYISGIYEKEGAGKIYLLDLDKIFSAILD